MAKRVIQNWLLIFIIGFGFLNLLPFAAPIFMEAGWKDGASPIYRFYGFLCHQMAQRSFFLFGDSLMLNADELPVSLTGNTTVDTLTLRNFTGNDSTGWKVAWSDRMIYMYGSIWLAGMWYYWRMRIRRQTVRPVGLVFFIGSMIPVGLDGFTHFISDFEGLTQGFRYHNEWLAVLTGHVLPQWFYAGDALGSFNSTMRLVTGIIFGIGMAAYIFPLVDQMIRTALDYEEMGYQQRRPTT